MKLSDLCGEHYFSGVEVGEMYRDVCACNLVKFTLDNISYLAVEDPDDGYRSMCEELIVSSTPPRNSFSPVAVNCSMMEDSFGDEHDVLVIKDAVTDLVVLEIGTRYINDYYPCFHFYYNPENMACNQINVSSEELCQILLS